MTNLKSRQRRHYLFSIFNILTCCCLRYYSIYFSGDFVLWKIDNTDVYVEVTIQHSL